MSAAANAQAAVFDIVADLDTPVSAYLKLAPLGPRYLLESVEGGLRLARYSFIGFGAAREMKLSAQSLVINGEVEPAPASRAELLEALRTARDASPDLLPNVDEIPLAGGLVGYAAYDLVRYFESVGDKPDDDRVLGAWVATESVLVFDHLTRRIALLHAGSAADRHALKEQVITLLRGSLPASVAKGHFSEPVGSLERDEFIEHVHTCQSAIRSGDIYQIVLSVLFQGQHNLDPFNVYRALRLLNPSPYLFFLDVAGLQIAGSSPEALVRYIDGEASLRPIAGTRPRGQDRQQDEANEAELLADPKECAEHVMLVDLARNDLGRVAEVGSVQVNPYMTIERYSHVMHIVSGVCGQLAESFDAFDLFAATFPAGTLVGAPKVSAMRLIDQLEPVGRGLYGGTVGYFGRDGTLDQAITIRTLVFDGDQYSFQAGAGVVADSVPDAEFDEVLHKSAILRSALKMAAGGL